MMKTTAAAAAPIRHRDSERPPPSGSGAETLGKCSATRSGVCPDPQWGTDDVFGRSGKNKTMERLDGFLEGKSSRSRAGPPSARAAAERSPSVRYALWYRGASGPRWPGMAVTRQHPGCPVGPGPGSGCGEEPFNPSVLGTREHWDAAYERELQTFQDIGDAGEIWFGEESMTRIIRWLEKQKVPLDSSVLDIGTGNGVLLVELARSGYTNLTGIDYSPSAIQLSEKVREKEGMSHIKLKVEDFLAPSAELSGFEICIDKGTYDAISLNPDNAVGKRKQYVRSLCSVLKPEGFFLITSCNWTKEELLNEFREGFEILEELPTPKFCFGGRIGNSVTALVFQRKKVSPSILDKLD
ncbi:EEF1A lysine methyltransferase 2 [Dryobates pubescens]|nr:EEF1A lysine methyltransferase 2 [Dryobates pubescens]